MVPFGLDYILMTEGQYSGFLLLDLGVASLIIIEAPPQLATGWGVISELCH
jgi:hypothetical protein